MEIQINGDPRSLRAGTTISALLAQLGMEPRYVAVERNRELVPRSQHAQCVLHAGDSLEIVTLVGGG